MTSHIVISTVFHMLTQTYITEKGHTAHAEQETYVELKSLFYKLLPVPEESISMKPKGGKKKAKRKFRIIRVKYGYLNGNNLAFIIDNILLLLQNKQH